MSSPASLSARRRTPETQRVGEIYKALHNAERAIRALPFVKGDPEGAGEFLDALNATLPTTDEGRAVFGTIRMLDSYTPEILTFLKSMRRTAFSMWTCPENVGKYLGLPKQWALDYDIDAGQYSVRKLRTRRLKAPAAKRSGSAALSPGDRAKIIKDLRAKDVDAPRSRTWASVASSPVAPQAAAPAVAAPKENGGPSVAKNVKRAGASEDRAGAVEERAGAVEERAGATEKRAGATEKRAGAVEERAEAAEERTEAAEECADKTADVGTRAGLPEKEEAPSDCAQKICEEVAPAKGMELEFRALKYTQHTFDNLTVCAHPSFAVVWG